MRARRSAAILTLTTGALDILRAALALFCLALVAAFVRLLLGRRTLADRAGRGRHVAGAGPGRPRRRAPGRRMTDEGGLRRRAAGYFQRASVLGPRKQSM